MTLKQQLSEDLKDAMRAGDERRRTALRLVTAGIRNAEIAAGRPLDDAEIVKLIQREARQRQDSIEQFQKAGRRDLVEKERAELVVLETYLPAQASREEIAAEARKVIDEVGAAGPQDKGKVMPVIIQRLAGRADGREINEVVTEILQDMARS